MRRTILEAAVGAQKLQPVPCQCVSALIRPGAGAVFALDADVVGCGRDRGNQIVLDGATVSRKHAEFRRQGARYVVSDLGSLNGTYVNGERVELAVLAIGDQIRIGRYVLFFATG